VESEEKMQSRIDVQCDEDILNVEFFDTPGSEELGDELNETISHGNVFVIVYSIDSSKSFAVVEDLITRVRKVKNNPNVPIMVVGNKTDLDSIRQVPIEDLKKLAKKHNIRFAETSAKANINIDDTIYETIKYFKNKKKAVMKKLMVGSGVATNALSSREVNSTGSKSNLLADVGVNSIGESPRSIAENRISIKRAKTFQSYNIVVIGGSSVGKTSLLSRFVTGTFSEDYDPTIEESFQKQVEIDGEEFVLDIVDTGGQEFFFDRANLDKYFENAEGFLMVYSIVDKNSFAELQQFKEGIEKKKGKKEVPMMIVGNKVDLENQRQVTLADGRQFAKKLNAFFTETSAKANQNINDAFFPLARQMSSIRSSTTQQS